MKEKRNAKSLEAVTHTHTHNTFTKILKREKSNCRGTAVFGDLENKKCNIKQNVGADLVSANAITLITLVITIVILIILAGVTINLTLGDNVLFTKAKEAKSQYESVNIKEQIEAAVLTAKMNENGTIDTTVLENELRNTYNITDITKSEGISLKWTVKKDGYEFIIGGVENTDKYGYKVDDYHAPGSSDDVWRLFYQDSEYTYIISDALIGTYKPSYYYTTVKGEDGNLKYQSGADVSTIGQKLNPIIISLFTTSYTSPNILATAWLTDTTQWEQYKTDDAEYAIGSPTVELFAASYNNRSNKTNTIALSKDTYGYTYNTQSDWLSTDTNHGIYNKNTSSYWWFASPGGGNSNFGLAVKGGNGSFVEEGVGASLWVRPIVCFKTSVFNKNYTSLSDD